MLRLATVGSIVLAAALAACQHPAAGTGRAGAVQAQPAAGRFSGDVVAVDPAEKTLKVRVVFSLRTFQVEESCEIVTATSRAAGLVDLQVGDAVEVEYLAADDPLPRAQRIRVLGVTADERESAREAERWERILTPNPSER